MSNNSNNSPTNTISNTANLSKTSNTETTNADISTYITNPFINSDNITNPPTLDDNNYLIIILQILLQAQLNNAGNKWEILKQNRYLYLLVKELRRDVKEIKDELKQQRKEKKNDLSSQVLDISGSGFALFNYKL
ncbi:24031_t:CDS:2 [Dentiscutata erythropus]|uniref:24031_t:CDS:1 n=1 Tax=Dentiscutata erythropus TaxID=1348616 RepID=A0A9N9IZ74_9GLOM|nr:24031_t:CDS:2 [Dentiscutata erythropus]